MKKIMTYKFDVQGIKNRAAAREELKNDTGALGARIDMAIDEWRERHEYAEPDQIIVKRRGRVVARIKRRGEEWILPSGQVIMTAMASLRHWEEIERQNML